MSQTPKAIPRKCLALGLVVGFALSGTWLVDALACLLQECIEDDAARLADALVGDIVVVGYAVFTLVVVFLPAVRLHRMFAMPVAAAIPSLALAAGITFLVFDPKIDSAVGTLAHGLWLAGPWFVASLIGLAVWPKAKAATAAVDVSCFD